MPVEPFVSGNALNGKRVLLLFVLSLISFSFIAGSASAATRYVATTGVDTLNDCLTQISPCLTIQHAIDEAVAGDTVNVAAGTYVEQVNIAKPLTLSGSGYANTHIISPDPSTMTIYDSFGSKSSTPRYLGHRAADLSVVRIVASNVNFRGFHIDLNDQTFWDVKGSYSTPYSRGVAILVDHVETVPGAPNIFTDIIIENNKIDGLKFGDQGDGIKVLGSAIATIKNNIIYGYGNSGISCQGVDSPVRAAYYPTCTVNDNAVYGGIGSGARGDTDFLGIGFWSGAAGSADGNKIYNTPDLYPDGTPCGSALNSWTPRPVSFTNNLVTSDGGGTGGWGAQLIESPDLTFSNNVIEKQSLAAGIWSNPIVSITNNKIIDCIDGFVVDQQTSGSITMNFNSFSGISSGHYAVKVGGPTDADSGTTWGTWHGESTVIVNAENNWWGSNSGPSHMSSSVDCKPPSEGGWNCNLCNENPDGTGAKVSDNVDYCPWLQLSLDLTSPNDGENYDARRIWINATTSILVDEIEYSLDGGSYKKLCADCDEYKAKKTFSDGSHTLVVRASIGSETDEEPVSFFVDSDEPEIKKTLPEDGTILHGTEFYVKYTESDLQSVKLYWKESTAVTYTSVPVPGCVSGTNKECEIDIDLSSGSYDEKYINYYFELKDKANTVTSSVKTIKIDNTNPTVTIVSPAPEDKIYADTRVYLTANVGVGDVVETLEYQLDGGSWRRLCRDCNSYSSRKTFSYGYHTLVVRATDYAGNIGEATRHFSVDNKEPKILDQYPANKKYTNGTFTVVYTEENLVSVSLFWKPLSGAYTEVPLIGCMPGKKQECSTFVNLASYNGQVINYYFVVRNHVTETACDEYKETVDVVAPTITINSPIPSYTSRRVEFDISITEATMPEKVKLEYSDNGGSFRIFCSGCSDYEGTKSFSKGYHSLLIKATDKAGNVDVEAATFTVV